MYFINRFQHIVIFQGHFTLFLPPGCDWELFLFVICTVARILSSIGECTFCLATALDTHLWASYFFLCSHVSSNLCFCELLPQDARNTHTLSCKVMSYIRPPTRLLWRTAAITVCTTTRADHLTGSGRRSWGRRWWAVIWGDPSLMPGSLFGGFTSGYAASDIDVEG